MFFVYATFLGPMGQHQAKETYV